MKTFKQLRIELDEQDYGSAWERVKSGASQIGAGAAEAGRTFVKRDLPVIVKKGEQAYQKTIKPVAKKVAGAVGGAMEAGGKKLQSVSEEELDQIIDFINDETIDEALRIEVYEAVDWDAVGKGLAQGLTFDNAPKIKAKAKSWLKGTKYDDELEKEKSEYEKAKERSPGSYTAGEVGSFFVPAGGAVLGLAKGAKAAKGAFIGAKAIRQGSKAVKAGKEVKKAEANLDLARKAASEVGSGRDLKKVTSAENKLSNAMNKQQDYTAKMKSLVKKQEAIKNQSVFSPTKLKIKSTIAGAAAIGLGKNASETASDKTQKLQDRVSQLKAEREAREARAKELQQKGKESIAQKTSGDTEGRSSIPAKQPEMPDSDLNDLRASVAKMRDATSAAAEKTGEMKSAMQKLSSASKSR